MYLPLLLTPFYALDLWTLRLRLADTVYFKSNFTEGGCIHYVAPVKYKGRFGHALVDALVVETLEFIPEGWHAMAQSSIPHVQQNSFWEVSTVLPRFQNNLNKDSGLPIQQLHICPLYCTSYACMETRHTWCTPPLTTRSRSPKRAHRPLQSKHPRKLRSVPRANDIPMSGGRMRTHAISAFEHINRKLQPHVIQCTKAEQVSPILQA